MFNNMRIYHRVYLAVHQITSFSPWTLCDQASSSVYTYDEKDFEDSLLTTSV